MGVPDGERSRVVLLGASKYADAEALPEIPEILRNVADIAATLTDPQYGIVPPEHCTTILDETNLPRLGRRLRAVIEQASDLLLIYYAGHGLKAGPRHELYLAMYDTDPQEPDFGALKYETLRKLVLDSGAKSKVIILDCCFSGRALGNELAGATESLLGQLEIEGCCLLTSAQADNVALVLPGERHTAFTGRLLSLLGEGIPNDSEFITFDQLYHRLRDSLQRQSLPIPLSRGSRTVRDLVLHRNRAHRTAAVELTRLRRAEAVARATAGRWSQALDELRDILAEQLRVLGQEHEETLRTRQLVAHAIGATGDPREASYLLRELLEVQVRKYGADHADTMLTRQFLAVNLGESRSRGEAASLLRILLPDRRRVLGPAHPDTLRTQHMLARNVAMLGAHAEAVALLRELVALCQDLDRDEPVLAWARRDLTALTGSEDADV
ncbi:tetratricopeptide repeat protein [Dactylosporangium sp. NPDC048998]|uniref:caspase family protein n=1 Tax=Dactylosporangium sp. NPDC048998 TaxID=3363976 RepID=UPI00372034CE